MTLTSQKQRQYNNKFECSEANSYNIPQDAINEVKVFSKKYRHGDILLKDHKLHLFFDRIMDFNRAEPTCYANNMQLFHT